MAGRSQFDRSHFIKEMVDFFERVASNQPIAS
jgi:hypothetical protein